MGKRKRTTWVSKKGSNSQLILNLEDCGGWVHKSVFLFFSQMHIGDTQYPSSPKLCRQAKKHFTIDIVKTLCKNRHRVDPPLVPKNASCQVRHRVSYRPRSVPFQTYNLVSTLCNFFVYVFQHFLLVRNFLFLQKAQHRNTPNTNARPQSHWAVTVFSHYKSL